MADKNGTIKIEHKRSRHFTSQFATGTILSGPTPDGYYHMIFYSDVVDVVSETGIKSAEDKYSLSIQKDDLFNHREDKARISMDEAALLRIYTLLKERFEADEIH